MKKLITQLAEKTGLIVTAKAHCDVPCGIYDTGPALYHAVSVVRLMDQFLAADDSAFLTKARLVANKPVCRYAFLVLHMVPIFLLGLWPH